MKLASALVGLVWILTTPVVATAAAPPAVQVEDPVGDANLINGTWVAADAGGPFLGNVTTPTDLSAAADIVKAWYTQTTKTLFLNIRTEGPPGTDAAPITYRLYANINPFWKMPDLKAMATFDGGRLVKARYFDGSCRPGESMPASATAKALGDGAGLVRIGIPRRDCPGTFGTGALITDTTVLTDVRADGGLNPNDYLDLVTLDNTEPGEDYVIGS